MGKKLLQAYLKEMLIKLGVSEKSYITWCFREKLYKRTVKTFIILLCVPKSISLNAAVTTLCW